MVTRPPFSNPEPETVPSRPTPAKRKAMPVKTPPARTTKPAPTKKPMAKKAPGRKAAVKKAAASRTTTATKPEGALDSAPQGGSPEPMPGPVETAVRKELEAAGVAHSALAASAIAMARNVDRAETAAGASSAARELRIVLPLARTTVNPLSPPAAAKSSQDESDEESSEPSPTRLKLVRERAAKRAARASTA